MKIFQLLQKNIAHLGLAADQIPFNKRSLLIIFIFCSGIILNCVYFFHRAKTFQEYAESVFVVTAIIVVTLDFTFIVWRMRHFSNCVNEAEQIIDDSEFRIINHINQ